MLPEITPFEKGIFYCGVQQFFVWKQIFGRLIRRDTSKKKKKMYELFQICFKIKQKCCLSPIFYQMDFMRGDIVSIVLVKVHVKLILFLKHLLAG